jgi:hypothetical protein
VWRGSGGLELELTTHLHLALTLHTSKGIILLLLCTYYGKSWKSLLLFNFTAKNNFYGNTIIKETHQPNALLKPKTMKIETESLNIK